MAEHLADYQEKYLPVFKLSTFMPSDVHCHDDKGFETFQ